MSVKVGDKAPNFTLVTDEKKLISLDELRGQNVVLLFFPFAFTNVCTKEMCMMRDDISHYQNLDARIIGISVDSPHTLAKYKELEKLNFTLLSDFNKEASRAYGAFYEELYGLRGVAKRSAFVIDKEGTIRYAEVLESVGDLPNFEAVNATLASLN